MKLKHIILQILKSAQCLPGQNTEKNNTEKETTSKHTKQINRFPSGIATTIKYLKFLYDRLGKNNSEQVTIEHYVTCKAVDLRKKREDLK